MNIDRDFVIANKGGLEVTNDGREMQDTEAEDLLRKARKSED